MALNDAAQRPPSVDTLARSLASTGLPHPLLVDAAREAIALGDPSRAASIAEGIAASLLVPVINATGVIAHTNLGRSPVALNLAPRAQNLEFDLATGGRGSRQRGIGRLIARAVGADDAMVVNNNAAAVLLVLAALASGRDVAVSRGESVEIGGGFRVPDVMEQSGARLVDVGTTNRTRVADYRKAIGRKGNDVALVLKVHPSNYRIDGFVEDTPVSELATLGVPVVADIGSGLLDAACPWLDSGPPTWLNGEPAARQSLQAGASLITFSGDKLMGGPQTGIIAGRADLVASCAQHPLARALRPGGLVLAALHKVMLAYLARTVTAEVPFWRIASVSTDQLQRRAESIATHVAGARVVRCESLPGAGSTPGASIPSVGVAIDGDHTAALRSSRPPVIARVRDDVTILDLRTVDPSDDHVVVDALRQTLASR
ncbi:MAG: L-seryl-tRNA(Sec) selenium transferase [Actinobacteria bacterium]|nr:L-seryl-tRNA(Sec) selenium transferase [Actinomycetota bacterium]